MSKMCPSCREIVELGAAKCASCGLQFHKGAAELSSFPATCLRIGGLAVALAIAVLAVMRLT